MSHFYASIPTSARKTQATARGHKTTGIKTQAMTYEGCLTVHLWHDPETGRDRYDITFGDHPDHDAGGKPRGKLSGFVDDSELIPDFPRV